MSCLICVCVTLTSDKLDAVASSLGVSCKPQAACSSLHDTTVRERAGHAIYTGTSSCSPHLQEHASSVRHLSRHCRCLHLRSCQRSGSSKCLVSSPCSLHYQHEYYSCRCTRMACTHFNVLSCCAFS